MSKVPVPYFEKSDKEKSCNACTSCCRRLRLTRDAIWAAKYTALSEPMTVTKEAASMAIAEATDGVQVALQNAFINDAGR